MEGWSPGSEGAEGGEGEGEEGEERGRDGRMYGGRERGESEWEALLNHGEGGSQGANASKGEG